MILYFLHLAPDICKLLLVCGCSPLVPFPSDDGDGNGRRPPGLRLSFTIPYDILRLGSANPSLNLCCLPPPPSLPISGGAATSIDVTISYYVL